jgi:hypothetical protein
VASFEQDANPKFGMEIKERTTSECPCIFLASCPLFHIRINLSADAE